MREDEICEFKTIICEVLHSPCHLIGIHDSDVELDVSMVFALNVEEMGNCGYITDEKDSRE